MFPNLVQVWRVCTYYAHWRTWHTCCMFDLSQVCLITLTTCPQICWLLISTTTSYWFLQYQSISHIHMLLFRACIPFKRHCWSCCRLFTTAPHWLRCKSFFYALIWAPQRVSMICQSRKRSWRRPRLWALRDKARRRWRLAPVLGPLEGLHPSCWMWGIRHVHNWGNLVGGLEHVYYIVYFP